MIPYFEVLFIVAQNHIPRGGTDRRPNVHAHARGLISLCCLESFVCAIQGHRFSPRRTSFSILSHIMLSTTCVCTNPFHECVHRIYDSTDGKHVRFWAPGSEWKNTAGRTVDVASSRNHPLNHLVCLGGTSMLCAPRIFERRGALVKLRSARSASRRAMVTKMGSGFKAAGRPKEDTHSTVQVMRQHHA